MHLFFVLFSQAAILYVNLCNSQLTSPNPIFPDGSYISDPFSAALRRYAFRGFRRAQFNTAVGRAPWVLRCRIINEECAAHAQCCSFYCSAGYYPHQQQFLLNDMTQFIAENENAEIPMAGTRQSLLLLDKNQEASALRMLEIGESKTSSNKIISTLSKKCSFETKRKFLNIVKTISTHFNLYHPYITSANGDAFLTSNTTFRDSGYSDRTLVLSEIIQMIESNTDSNIMSSEYSYYRHLTELTNGCSLRLGFPKKPYPPYYYTYIDKGNLQPRGTVIDVLKAGALLYNHIANSVHIDTDRQLQPSIAVEYYFISPTIHQDANTSFMELDDYCKLLSPLNLDGMIYYGLPPDSSHNNTTGCFKHFVYIHQIASVSRIWKKTSSINDVVYTNAENQNKRTPVSEEEHLAQETHKHNDYCISAAANNTKLVDMLTQIPISNILTQLCFGYFKDIVLDSKTAEWYLTHMNLQQRRGVRVTDTIMKPFQPCILYETDRPFVMVALT